MDSKAERGRLNLAHVARKKMKKKKLKRQCPLSSVQVKVREGKLFRFMPIHCQKRHPSHPWSSVYHE